MADDSDDSDIFVEFQLKPVNNLTKKDGFRIKNNVLRQAKLSFDGVSSKSKNEVIITKEVLKIDSSTEQRRKIKTSSPKAKLKQKTPKKSTIAYFSDSSTEKTSPTLSQSASTGRISVRNDLVINVDVSISSKDGNQKLPDSIPIDIKFNQNKLETTSPPKCIDDYFKILGSPIKNYGEKSPSPKKPKLQPQETSDEIEIINLSPGIKRNKNSFKSISNLTKSPSPKNRPNNANRNLFSVPSFSETHEDSPKSASTPLARKGANKTREDNFVENLDAEILGTIFQEVIRNQLELKEMTKSTGKIFCSLLSDFEMDIMERYTCLDRNSQTLFMRMYFRKPGWHRVSNITEYQDLSLHLENELTVLESMKLIQTNLENESLECQLTLLKSAELSRLCKGFNVAGNGFLRKGELADALLVDIRKQKSVLDLFKVSTGSSRLELVGAEVRKLLGTCFQLQPDCRVAISRIILLFSLSHDIDDEAKRGTSQRFMMHQVLTGVITFVPYKVMPIVIFETREDFLEYENALLLRQEFDAALQAKLHTAFMAISRKSRNIFKRLVADNGYCERVSKLPSYLRRLSAGSVHSSILTQFCEHLKKETSTQEIIEVLLDLLRQKTFGYGARGKWYELLCKSYQSAKMSEDAAKIITEASKDGSVDEVQALALQTRAAALLKGKKYPLVDPIIRGALQSFTDVSMEEPTSIEINAQALSGNTQGSKLVYVQQTATGTRYSSVEEQAIYFYKTHGYPEGCHTEGFIVSTIFYLFFFDLIYSTTSAGVFLSQYQERPLDLWSSSFFENRRDKVIERLREIRSWTSQVIAEKIEDTFARYKGTSCVIAWRDGFTPLLLCNIIECIGMTGLSAICERFVYKPRLCRSGFPDLILWNTQNKTCKFVEVKSPNDRLSFKQRVWLHFLKTNGIECEVCNVRNTASKSLR